MNPRRPPLAASGLLLTLAASAAAAQDTSPPPPSPRQFIVQAGMAEDASSLVVGFTRGWRWQRELSMGRLSGQWEVSIGRWRVPHRPGAVITPWVTQVGLTPVFRLQPHGWSDRWLIEGGIGLNWLSPIYRNHNKQFSTSFNFGDHLALVRRFGAGGEQELALRFQHFSNGRIRKPNPGENFLQLRYAQRF